MLYASIVCMIFLSIRALNYGQYFLYTYFHFLIKYDFKAPLRVVELSNDLTYFYKGG